MIRMLCLQAVLLALALPFARAGCCPNACSGHGTCGVDDQCTCYPNWQNGEDNAEQGDCGSRQCPFELAWADAPDINGQHHTYAECANKGVCDRSTGQCVCFEGYSGKGCQRQTCPNDCSGHGRCMLIQDIPFGTTVADSYLSPVSGTDASSDLGSTNFNDAKTWAYPNWDNQKSMSCKCDGGWQGVDCSLRMCPEGNDVMVEPSDGTTTHQVQGICLHNAEASYGVTANQNFALSFTTQAGERYTTQPITMDMTENPAYNAAQDITDQANLANTAAAIKAALEALPNGAIDEVFVEVLTHSTGITQTTTGSHTIHTLMSTGLAAACELLILVQFKGPHVSGNQNLLELENTLCASQGCSPYIASPALIADDTTNTLYGYVARQSCMPYVKQVIASDEESAVCGGRGKCDYSAGQCQCFSGYYGLHCETQTALI
ncbi:unnamed protein product [Chrysoparadoxa australica]